MPLYQISVNVDFMACAENVEEAWANARKWALDSIRNDGCEVEAIEEATRIEDVPTHWRDCLPWGGGLGDDEKTCRELLAVSVKND